ncbi:Thiamin-regulated outer membrane receptor Omr1 [Fulvivirga imtechensis AK7]|uniref:Thiamin-regulated outer membrane receptor Omr1 n=1 Tax=Fulvivirga imtechensis AK7 TaxID=1237149 RepID=L8JWR7_9BACT|nr:TonB-dependent receptor [Fulvivirga imtechensis]ELR72643.1 Thiamin-regulated outer membrane receptor Omr1 [Fulvivirga imtechensis AK7]
MKCLLLTALMLLTAFVSYGQFSVSGIVKDADTSEPLPGANIFLGEKARATDNEGRFTFTSVSKGIYQLKVTYIGYNIYEQRLTLDDNKELQIVLKPDVFMADEVIVSATRATEKTPTTYTNVDKDEIEANNLGQDLPYLLNMTPSLVTTSDAGAGVGYTGLRIRGSDASRINVTINGIPLNDSESQGVYWVDIPDIASSTENIQIQRGVGTSTNGAGAFGGTINLQTNTKKEKAHGEVINSFGSYDTWRHTLGFGTGLINDRWTFNGRLSKITSDGYIDRATSDLNSYYLSGGYYGKNTLIKAIIFGGKERTYQSWYGTPEARLENDMEGMNVVADLNGFTPEQRANLLESGRTYNFYQYKNEVDDYQQDHYQLHLSQQITNAITAGLSFHYTYGRGFYEQFKEDDDFEDYGLPDVVVGGSTISSSDIIRRRWLDNDFYGVTYSFEYNEGKWNVVLGGAYNKYVGDHFGEIIWAEYAVNSFIEDRYYDNTGHKDDFNTFIKANYQLNDRLNVFGDIQYRNIQYEVDGIDNDLRILAVDAAYDFFNPKFGLLYDLNSTSHLYASYSIANREPVRTDFIDSPEKPRHETLRNLEAGYRKQGSGYHIAANYYLMDYQNQLVLTGELNDVGSPLRTNVSESYRMGVELQGQLRLLDQLRWSANATFSRNKIGLFREVVYDYGADWDEFNVVETTHEDTDISFSPNIVAASQLTCLPFRGMEISLLSKYVGKQYLDNTSNDNRAIEAYFVNDLRLRYTLYTSLIKEIGVTFQVNNIFDERYSSNGYTFGYRAGDFIVRENYYYPQATTNFLASVTLKF